MSPAKPAEIKFDQLAALWAKGTFHPVYLFAGPDTLQKDTAVQTFQKHFLGGDESGLNVDKFDGETVSGGDILNAFRTMAFLGGRRLVLVRRAHDLSAAEAGLLADGLAAAPSGNALILLWDEKAEATNVLIQAAKSAGVMTTFWAPFENQMPAWIQGRAGSQGKGMSVDAAKALLEAVGPSLPDLAQEIDKLALFAKDKKTIDIGDVEALRPESPALQYLEFDRALWRRDRPEALRMANLRKSQGDPPEVLLSHLARIYRKLFLGKTLLAEKKADRETVALQAVRVKMFQPRDEYVKALSAYSWDDLLGGMERILKAERDLKTGRMDPEAGISLLICSLLARPA